MHQFFVDIFQKRLQFRPKFVITKWTSQSPDLSEFAHCDPTAGTCQTVQALVRCGVQFLKFCCQIRKVEPMRRQLAELDAYVTGLRRDQNVTRSGTPKVLVDESHGGILKINPLADWDSNRVWQYVRKHNVPVNRLHRSGYPSVGCDPCTRAIRPGDDQRSGRWWWEQADTKECGLHDQGSGI